MKKIASKLKWKLISVIKNAFHASVNFLRRPQYLLFYRNCIISPQEIQIYGQYSKKPPTSIIIYQNGVSLSPRIQIVLCGDQPDFLIRIRDVQYLPEDRFTIKLNGKTVCSNEQLIDPLSFRLEFSEIVIATMVKNGKDRILEWINYHLALGVDKIIVYLNNSTDGTEEVIKKINNPNVISVLFPYKPFADWHWNNIQKSNSVLTPIFSGTFASGYVLLTWMNLYTSMNPPIKVNRYLKSTFANLTTSSFGNRNRCLQFLLYKRTIILSAKSRCNQVLSS